MAWAPAAAEVSTSSSMEYIHESLPHTASSQSPIPSTACSKGRLDFEIMQQQDVSESTFTVSTLGDAEVESASPGSVSGILPRCTSHSSAGSACGKDLEDADKQKSPTAVSEAHEDFLRYSSADTVAEQPPSHTSRAGEEEGITVPGSTAYETSNAVTTTANIRDDDASITTDPVSDRSFSVVSSDEVEAPPQHDNRSPQDADMGIDISTETCKTGRKPHAKAVTGSLLLDSSITSIGLATGDSGVPSEEEVVWAQTWQEHTQGGIHENRVDHSVDKHFSAGSSISSVAEELEAPLAPKTSSMSGDENEALGSHLHDVEADVAPDSSASVARAVGTGPFEDVPHLLQQAQVQGECALSFPTACSVPETGVYDYKPKVC